MLTAVVVGAVGLVAPARAEDPDPVGASVPVAEDLAVDAPPPVSAADAADSDESGVGAVVRTEDGLEVVTVEADPGEAEDVVTDLERDPDVLDAFVDVPATIAATDPLRADQWNLDELNLGAGVLPDSTDDGSSAVVAVIDTGVDHTHPDLQEPDPSRPGYTRSRVRCSLGADFTQGSTPILGGGRCSDPHGHGTHVAGIVSAVAGNGIGVAGVSAARIMPVRVLDANGRGMTSSIVAGIVWAVDHGADVLNLSVVSDQTDAYHEAIQHALAKDVVVVAAAGNNRALGNEPQWPASEPGVIAVAATDEMGLSAPFSHSGTSNFIAAPGDGILSTTHSGYDWMTGTSMASPHVAGILARYRAIHPTADVEQVRAAVAATAIDLQTEGQDTDTGHGLLNAYRLLTGDPEPADPTRGVVPTTPRQISVTAGTSALTVRWAPPVWNGGSPLTSYDLLVAQQIGDDLVPVAADSVGPSETQAVLGLGLGLERGASYRVVMTADNINGQGQYSLPSNAVRVPTRPTAARIGTPTAGPGAARVRWSAPTSSGGSPITGYVVRAYRGWDVVAEVRVPATARDVRIGGLTNGRAHTFLVRAVNAVGPGPWSARSIAVTPLARPGAPAIGTPAAADDAARVYWRAPSDNGGATISAYVIKVYQGTRGIKSVTVSGSARSALVTGLANKAYYSFTVTAKNVVGLGTPSPRSATVRTT